MSNSIGTNRLGIEGRQKTLGYLLLCSGLFCLAFLVIRALLMVETTWDAILFVTLATLLPFGIRQRWAGAHIALDVINDVAGPASLNDQRTTAEEL